MLADRGIYLASESTYYRILKAKNQLHHRGSSKPRGTYTRPVSYTARAPNQVWSWDITHLPGEVKGERYYLYMIMDVYSRKIVAAEVREVERGEYAAGRYRGELQEQWVDPALRQWGTDEELHHAGQNVRTRGLLIIQQTEGQQ